MNAHMMKRQCAMWRPMNPKDACDNSWEAWEGVVDLPSIGEPHRTVADAQKRLELWPAEELGRNCPGINGLPSTRKPSPDEAQHAH